jgi:hypothetical protein
MLSSLILSQNADHVSQRGYPTVEKQASGRQPRRVAIWKAQHIVRN